MKDLNESTRRDVLEPQYDVVKIGKGNYGIREYSPINDIFRIVLSEFKSEQEADEFIYSSELNR